MLRAHFLVAEFSMTHGRPVAQLGPKSIELLHSAVYRQFVALGSREKWPTSLEKCATLLFGITKDHAFHDANKRTALLVTLLFLQKKCINRITTASDQQIEDFLVDVADDKLDKHPRYRDLLRKGDPDAAVRFISDWLHRNTREMDKRSYSVTFQQLRTILHRFGFDLDNPNKNFIDVLRIERYRPLFGLAPPKTRKVRVAQIGFPGWKNQVDKGTMKTVRQATRLVPERGYDSQTFFNNVDPLHSLIAKYAQPLKRLADR